MTGVDLVIIVILLLAAVGGYRRGFVIQVASILGALAALAVARAEYPDVRHFLAGFAPQSSWLTVIAYLIVFLAVWAAIIVVARRIRGLLHILQLGWMDRLGGVVIGLLQGALLLVLLLSLGRIVPNHQLKQAIARSTLAPTFLHLTPALHRFLPHIRT